MDPGKELVQLCNASSQEMKNTFSVYAIFRKSNVNQVGHIFSKILINQKCNIEFHKFTDAFEKSLTSLPLSDCKTSGIIQLLRMQTNSSPISSPFLCFNVPTNPSVDK
jgi:hypothetical protein